MQRQKAWYRSLSTSEKAQVPSDPGFGGVSAPGVSSGRDLGTAQQQAGTGTSGVRKTIAVEPPPPREKAVVAPMAVPGIAPPPDVKMDATIPANTTPGNIAKATAATQAYANATGANSSQGTSAFTDMLAALGFPGSGGVQPPTGDGQLPPQDGAGNVVGETGPGLPPPPTWTYAPEPERVTGDPYKGVSAPIITNTPNPNAFQPVTPGGLPAPTDVSGAINTPGLNATTGARNPATTSTNVNPWGQTTPNQTTQMNPFGGGGSPTLGGATGSPPQLGGGGGHPLAKPGADANTVYGRLNPSDRASVDQQVQKYWQDLNHGKRPGTYDPTPPDELYEQFAASNANLAGSGGGGGENGEPPMSVTNSPEVAAAMTNLLQRIQTETDPTKLNALLETYLGLSNLGTQNFFTSQFGPAASDVGDLGGLANQYGQSPYNIPNTPNLDPAQVYAEGEPGANMMQYALDQIDRTNIPLENLRDLAGESAQYLESRSGDMVNPYRAQVEEQYAHQERQLRSAMAARGMSNSTEMDEALNRLQESKARARADADLQFYTTVGSERRADTGMVGDLLSGLFNQQMEGSQFALDRVGALAGVTGQAEQMDLARRSVEAQRSQTMFDDMMQSLMASENIPVQRLQAMSQPLAMLLSAITGTNVSPGVLGPLQMPRQQPGFGEMLGGALGGAVSNLPLMKRG